MACELADLLEIGGLCVRRQVADLHVPGHAAAKVRHWNLPLRLHGAASSTPCCRSGVPSKMRDLSRRVENLSTNATAERFRPSCLMGKLGNGELTVTCWCSCHVAANPAHHYEAPLRKA